ncbi:PhnD/SsuA/transferrin family substrate-binding protein [Diaphorobacter ruginosibacter]|uniref:PhnD/SsuA/transferrin family substrate-binding protein n=1 Tax=Diaphorobacter ruginosibacter TaxID=1715720 RepID=A0A7G9RQN9_9BURK|nr:PhnD/SsuA/transferrin family substrate-binding protein [Diaphorobacter ruginosibacter]QNN57914.1 PhnD/SsuA/transferrin family substrate-binding protein [Diaphorobacter ruginosibacter]
MNRRESLRSLSLAAVSASFPVLAASQGRSFRVGLTPVMLADQFGFLTRWGQYLSERTNLQVEFVARETYQGILDLLFSQQVHAAWICGYPYIRFEAELELLAVPLYQGKPTYQSYLIRSPTNSPTINGWQDLRGQVLAYSDPLSNSGWLVAQVQLAKAGIQAQHLKKAFFTHGHRNVAEAVAVGLAQAGTIDGYVWETMRLQKMSSAMKTEVIWKSEFFGFPPLVIRRGQGDERTAKLGHALNEMANDSAGKEFLAALNLTGFIKGQPELYDSIRKEAQQVPGSGVAP